MIHSITYKSSDKEMFMSMLPADASPWRRSLHQLQVLTIRLFDDASMVAASLRDWLELEVDTSELEIDTSAEKGTGSTDAESADNVDTEESRIESKMLSALSDHSWLCHEWLDQWKGPGKRHHWISDAVASAIWARLHGVDGVDHQDHRDAVESSAGIDVDSDAGSIDSDSGRLRLKTGDRLTVERLVSKLNCPSEDDPSGCAKLRQIFAYLCLRKCVCSLHTFAYPLTKGERIDTRVPEYEVLLQRLALVAELGLIIGGYGTADKVLLNVGADKHGLNVGAREKVVLASTSSAIPLRNFLEGVGRFIVTECGNSPERLGSKKGRMVEERAADHDVSAHFGNDAEASNIFSGAVSEFNEDINNIEVNDRALNSIKHKRPFEAALVSHLTKKRPFVMRRRSVPEIETDNSESVFDTWNSTQFWLENFGHRYVAVEASSEGDVLCLMTFRSYFQEHVLSKSDCNDSSPTEWSEFPDPTSVPTPVSLASWLRAIDPTVSKSDCNDSRSSETSLDLTAASPVILESLLCDIELRLWTPPIFPDGDGRDGVVKMDPTDTIFLKGGEFFLQKKRERSEKRSNAIRPLYLAQAPLIEQFDLGRFFQVDFCRVHSDSRPKSPNPKRRKSDTEGSENDLATNPEVTAVPSPGLTTLESLSKVLDTYWLENHVKGLARFGGNTMPVPVPPMVFFGGKKSVTDLHFDPYDNFLLQVVGTKVIQLYSPELNWILQNKKAEEGRTHFSEFKGRSHCQELRRQFDKCNTAKGTPQRSESFWRRVSLTVVLQAGDCLHIPRGWWHYVESDTPSISIAFMFNKKERS